VVGVREVPFPALFGQLLPRHVVRSSGTARAVALVDLSRKLPADSREDEVRPARSLGDADRPERRGVRVATLRLLDEGGDALAAMGDAGRDREAAVRLVEEVERARDREAVAVEADVGDPDCGQPRRAREQPVELRRVDVELEGPKVAGLVEARVAIGEELGACCGFAVDQVDHEPAGIGPRGEQLEPLVREP
jgi:hypothetical protein